MFARFINRKNKPKRAGRIRIKPPIAASDRNGLAIVAILKDEEKNILEWVRFHTAAGARFFVIYDNQSTDKTVEILRNALPPDSLIVIPWEMHTEDAKSGMILPRQILAYCHAISTFGSNFRWMTFIDIDEYLVPKSHPNLLKALDELKEFSNISLNWTMFGFNGHQDIPDGLTVKNYKNRAANPVAPEFNFINFKCIVDPCKVTVVSTHKFETSDMGANSANDVGVLAHNKFRKKPSFLSDTNIQLNHYYTFSKSELDAKIARGGVSGSKGNAHENRVRLIAKQIEEDTIEDLCAYDFWQRAVSDE